MRKHAGSDNCPTVQEKRPTAPPIAIFSCSTPVHARASNHPIDFVDMIGINIGGGQSPSMSDIDLHVDITPGAIYLVHNATHYELSLRRFRIILEKDNANVQVGTQFSAILQQGSVVTSDNQAESYKREFKADGSAGGELAAGLTSWLTAKLSISGKGAGTVVSDQKTEVKSNTVYRVDLVVPTGQDSWTVGGPNGDPRRRTNDLRGQIIGYDSGDRLVPLCGLEAIDVAQPVAWRIRLRSTKTDFVLSDPKGDEVIAALFSSLEDDKDNFIHKDAFVRNAR